ncbi:hypothetical protein Plhal703r1_c13g0065491 [Plasmopara halstedii]
MKGNFHFSFGQEPLDNAPKFLVKTIAIMICLACPSTSRYVDINCVKGCEHEGGKYYDSCHRLGEGFSEDCCEEFCSDEH